MSTAARTVSRRFLTLLISALIIAGLLMSAAPASLASGATQTLGGTTVEGYLRITSQDDGRIGVERYASGAWQRQIYATYSKGSVVYYNGTKYSMGYFSPTAATFVSNYKTGNTIYSTWNAGVLRIDRQITYNDGDAYFYMRWDITNTGGSYLGDVRFLHGEDTYLKGGDNGAGWWDGNNQTIGVRKVISGVEQRMSLQGITTPYSYQSNNYSSVYSAVSAGALTRAIDGNESTDNGYALEWRTSLNGGQTWTVSAYEKFIADAVGSLQVIAPTAVDCSAGTVCNLTFTVRNPTGASLPATLSVSNDQGWPTQITSGTSVTVPGNGSVSVTVAVTAGAGGTSSYVSLTARPSSGQTSTDRAAVNAKLPPNNPPTSISLTSTSVAERQPSGTTVGNLSASDPEGDAVTFSLTSGNSYFTITGSVLKTAAMFNYEGQASYPIQIRATDSKGLSYTRDFIISVTNVIEAPTLNQPGAQSVNEDGTLNFAMTASDPDNNTGRLTWSVLTGPASGSLSGASGTGGSKSLTYQPQANFNGSDSFVIRVTGEGGSTSDQTVNVTVAAVNDVPTLSVPAGQTARVNQAWSFGPRTAVQIENRLRAGDIDAASLRVSLLAEHGSLSIGQRAGLAFTTGTGTGGESSLVFTGAISAVNDAFDSLVFQPAAGYDGPAQISVTVNDLGFTGLNGALSASDTIAITVANPAGFEVDPAYNSGTPGWGYDKFASIQAAIDASAGFNPAVSIAPGSYTENVTLNQPVTLTPTGDVQINGSLSLETGSWNAGDTTLSLGGDLSVANDAFARGTGSVAFVGEGIHLFTGSGTLNDITVADGSTLQLAGVSNLAYTGVMTLAGTGAFDGATAPLSTLTLAGTTPQALPAGNFTVSTLELDNPAGVTAGQAVTVHNSLFVRSGEFSPATGSIFGNVSISSGASINAPAELSVRGNWNNLGSFVHNHNTLTFNGTQEQTLTGSAAQTFGHVVVSSGDTVNASALETISADDLTISSGRFLAPAALNLDVIVSEDGTLSGGELDLAGSLTNAGTVEITDVLDLTGSLVNSGTFSAPAALNLGGSFTNTGDFAANAGTVTLSGGPGRTFSGAAVFHDLIVENTSLTLAENADLGYSGSFTLGAGGSFDPLANANTTLTIAGSGAHSLPAGLNTLNHLAILDGARLDAPALLNLQGNLANSGIFAPGTGTVAFTGSGPQSITGAGSTDFYNLRIANTAATPSDSADVDADTAMTVANQLELVSGQFQPSACLQGLDVVIRAGTTLKPDGAGCLKVSGSWDNQGQFIANGSTVTFNGSAAQAIQGENNAFYNLTIANTAEFPGDDVDVDPDHSIQVTNTLTVASGQFQPQSGSVFQHVAITLGTLRPDNQGYFSVTGNWARESEGWFEANSGQVVFSGTGAQAITGGTTFYDLTIANTGGLNDASDVDPDVAVSVTHNLFVETGQFQPPANSRFHNITIRDLAQLRPDGNITISGNLTNDPAGSYSHNQRAVTIDGSGVQEMTGAVDFYNLTINTGSTLRLMDNANLGYAGALTLKGTLDATSQPHTTVTVKGSQPQTLPNDLHLHDLVITGTSTLNAPAVLSVAGDFVRQGAGVFDAKGGLVIFDGAGAQQVSGSTTFHNAQVAGSTRLGIAGGSTMTLAGTMTQAGSGALDAGGTASTVVIAGTGGGYVLPSGSTVHNLVIQTSMDGPSLLTITGDWTNAGIFNHSWGKVVFDGTAAQAIVGPSLTSFHDLTLSTPAGLTGQRSLVVASILEIEEGDFRPAANTDLHHIQIDDGASLTPAGELTVSGWWNRHSGGTFNAGTHRVVFDGSAGQTITGGSFYDLKVLNSAAAPAGAPVASTGAVTVARLLDVADGQFDPFCGSDFASVTVAAEGILNLPGCAEGVTVSGDWTNDGAVAANSGVVTFDGGAAQTVGGSQPNPFHHLAVKNTAGGVTATGSLPASGDLTVFTGSFTPANNAAFANITIKDGAALAGPADGAFTVGGGWTDENLGGGFTAAGSTVRFSGAGLHLFTGSSIFHDLDVADGAILRAAASATLGLSGTLNLNDSGALDLTTNAAGLGIYGTDPAPLPGGLTVHHLLIGDGANFHAPELLLVTGDWSNRGTFTPTGTSAVHFTGTGNQHIVELLTNSTDFGSLVVDKSGELLGLRSVEAARSLTVTAGVFKPASGSQFGDVTISTGAALDLSTFDVPGGAIRVSGDWTNAGSFLPGGNSKVIFNGLAGHDQTISNPLPQTFVDLQIDGGTRLVDTDGPIHVSRDLIINADLFSPDTTSVFTNVRIGSGGVLNMPASGALTISGTWENYGAVAINGTTVDGNPQILTTYVDPAFSAYIDAENPGTPGFGLDHFDSIALAVAATSTSDTEPELIGTVFVAGGAGQSYPAAALAKDVKVQVEGDATLAGLTLSTGTFDATRASLLTISGSFSQTGGTFLAPSAGVDDGRLSVTADFSLSGGDFQASDGTLAVSGDFIQSGVTFTAGSGTLELTGAASPQNISATTIFHNLTINKTAADDEVQVDPAQPLLVSQAAVIQRGVLTTSEGSLFGDLTIETDGTLAVPAATLATVTDLYTNRGMLTIGAGGQLVADLLTVYVDDDYQSGVTSGYGFDHLDNLADALAAVADGGKIVVYGGLYDEAVTLPAGANLTFAPADGGEAVIRITSLDIADGGLDFSTPADDSQGWPATVFTGTLQISGDLDLAEGETFDVAGGTVALNGAAAQTLTGSLVFDNLTISNTAGEPANRTVTTAALVRVNSLLNVANGRFLPACGSIFHDVNIAPSGSLELGSGCTIRVSGDWTSGWLTSGGLVHNGSKVVFDGSGLQQIHGTWVDLGSVEIGPASRVQPDDAANLHIQGDWANHGQFLPGASTVVFDAGSHALSGTLNFGSLTLSAGSAVTPPSAATIELTGNWTNDGIFDPNQGTVLFTGSANQSLSGTANPQPFYNLTLNKIPASSTVTADPALALQNDLLVTSGKLVLLSSSAVAGDATVAAGGTLELGSLEPDRLANLTVAGSWNSSGTYNPVNGTVMPDNVTAVYVDPSYPDNTPGLGIDRFKSLKTALESAQVSAGAIITAYPGTYPDEPVSLTAEKPVTLNFSGNGAARFVLPGSLTLDGGTFNAPAGTLELRGSLALGGAEFRAGSGTLELAGSGAQTLTGSFTGDNRLNNLTLNNASGAAIAAAAEIGGRLATSQGTLTLAGGSTVHDVQLDGGTLTTATSGASLSVTGDWTHAGGAFAHNGSTVTFNTYNSQPVTHHTLTGTASFFNVVVAEANLLHLADGANLGLAGSLSVDGILDAYPAGGRSTVTMNGTGEQTLPAGLRLDHLAIAGTSVFNAPQTLIMSGDLTNDGVFNAGTGTLTLDGSQPQAIKGANQTDFNNLSVTGAGEVTPLHPMVVSGSLVVDGGPFSPAAGSTFNHIDINGPDGTFQAPNGRIDVKGSFDNGGTFQPGTGTVHFTGTSEQVILGSAPFYNLVINNPAGVDASAADSLNVGWELRVDAGTFKTPAAGATLRHVEINGGLLDGSAGDLTVRGNWTDQNPAPGGGFIAGEKTVTFDGTGNQTFSGHSNFHNLAINDGVTLRLADGANLGLSGALDLNGTGALDARPADGRTTVTLNGDGGQNLPAGLHLDHLVIGPDTIFNAPAALSLSGDLTNDGAFNPGTGTVTFDGAGAQAIGGESSTSFNNLVISNTSESAAVTADPAVSVLGMLDITDGQFRPAAGSDFNDVTIRAQGELYAPAGLPGISVSGSWDNDGTFTANGGTVTFDGSGPGPQAIGGDSINTFANLTIANTSDQPVSASPALTATGTLKLVDGTFVPASGSTFHHVDIADGAVLDGRNADLIVTGDWTNRSTSHGGYLSDPAGQISLSGAGPHAFSGETTFNDLDLGDGLLVLQEGSNLVLVGEMTTGTGTVTSPPGVESTLTLAGDGEQTLPTGLWLHSLVIGPQTTFNAPAELALGGDLTNTGVFNAGTGTVTFYGPGEQSITGALPDHALVFNNLSVTGGTLTPDQSITVAGGLDVTGGTFAPAAGSTFTDIHIGPDGAFEAPNGPIHVQGDFANQGEFDPGTGTVVFDGPAAQAITGAATFYTLEIDNPLGADAGGADSLVVERTLTLTGGTFETPAGADLHNVTIGAGGTLDAAAGGLTVSGSWTDNHPGGGFNAPADPAAVTFDGTGTHTYTGETTFGNLVVTGGTLVLGSGSDLRLTGDLATTGGALDARANAPTTVTFSGPGTHEISSGLDLSNVVIGAGSTLVGPEELSVSGGWTNNGTFTPGSGAVIFDGSQPQVIGGTQPTGFNDLVIANSGTPGSVTADPAVSVAGDLAVNDGQFRPAAGSDLHNVLIGQNGELSAPAGAPGLTVSGGWDNDGTFTANGGTVTFDGNGTEPQAIGGSSENTFANLVIQPQAPGTGASADPALTVTGELTVAGGTFDPASGSEFHDVTIAAGATLDGAGSSLIVTGDWTNDGSFNAGTGASTVVFSGGETQTIGGSTTPAAFNNLTVTGAGTVVDPDVSLGVGGTLTVSGGTVQIPTGSTLNNVNVGTTGTLVLDPGAEVTLNGEWTNNGTVNTNNGVVTTNPATTRITTVYVDSSYPPETSGLGIDRFTSIQAGFNQIAVGGTVTIYGGSYTGDAVLDTDASVVMLPSLAATPVADVTLTGSLELRQGDLAAPAGVLSISGSLTVEPAASFAANGGTVRLNGSAAQAVTGALAFHNLTIANTAETPADDAAVTTGTIVVGGLLDVADGQFMPGCGSDFAGVTIGAEGIFKPQDGPCLAGWTVSGNWTNHGSFSANGSLVIFDGEDNQTIAGDHATRFADLRIASPTESTVDANSVVHVDGTLTIALGRFQPVHNSTFNNLTIEEYGVILPDFDAVLRISGDLNNLGRFDHRQPDDDHPQANGETVIFNGTGPQAINGAVTFNNLTVQKTPATDAVDAELGVRVIGELNVASGQLLAPTGSVFHDVTIAGSGSLLSDAGAALSVSGDWTSTGLFDPNNGSLTFNGEGSQVVTGALALYDLIIQNSADPATDASDVHFNDPLTVANNTLVADGQLQPPAGSLFHNLAIGEDGIFRPVPPVDPENRTITITGDFSNLGLLQANGITIEGGRFSNVTVSGSFDEDTPGYGYDRFSSINAAIAKVIETGTVRVLSGTYAEDVLVNKEVRILVSESITIAGDLTFRRSTPGNPGTLQAPAAGTIAIAGDLTVEDGTLDTNGGTLAFTGSGAQSIAGLYTFDNLTIANLAETPGDALDVDPDQPVTVRGLLTVSDGQFQPPACSVFHDVTITAEGILKPDGTGCGSAISVSGDWANTGSFEAGSGTVILNGTQPQAISGTSTFNNLVVDNSQGVDASGGLTVAGGLTLTGGTLELPAGAVLADVTLEPGGSLSLPAGSVTVTGDWTDEHTETPSQSFSSGGTVIFGGEPPQVFSGETVFGSLTVADGSTLALAEGSTLGLTGDLTVQNGGTLDATGSPDTTVALLGDGTPAQNLSTGLELDNLVIGGGAVLNGPAELSIAGDWDNNGGTFAPGSGTVTFNGSGPQDIGGTTPTTFNDLVVANTSTSTPPAEVTTSQPPVVADDLVIDDGVFVPADGTDLHDVLIGAGGSLEPEAGATLEVGGDFTNDGEFDPNGGTVVFDGTTPQAVGGDSSPVVFDNLVVDTQANPVSGGGVILEDPITVTEEMTITAGPVTQVQPGSEFNDLTIGGEGSMTLEEGAAIQVLGEYTIQPGGSFNANGGMLAPNNVKLTGTDVENPQALAVVEHSPAGTLVASLATIDLDYEEGDTYTYSLEDGQGSQGNSAFEIVGDQLYTRERVNFEDQASYSIRVQTLDPDNLILQKVFTITITDVNETPEIDEGGSASLTIDEDNAPTAFALTLHATDLDGDPLTWTIEDQAASGTAGLTGGAGGTSKAITYTPDADWFGTDSFSVRVADGRGGSDLITVSVTVRSRNDAPVMSEAPVVSAPALPQIGSKLSVTSGAWNDNKDKQPGSMTITYQWQRTDAAADQAGGDPAPVDDLPGAEYNEYTVTPADQGRLLRVVVTATDNGSGVPAQMSTSFTSDWVLVDGSPLANLRLSQTSVLANTPAGTEIGRLSVSDPDAGDTFTYTLVDGEGAEDNAAFRIEKDSLLAETLLGANGETRYAIRVRGTDGGGHEVEARFLIRVIANQVSIQPGVPTSYQFGLPAETPGTLTVAVAEDSLDGPVTLAFSPNSAVSGVPAGSLFTGYGFDLLAYKDGALLPGYQFANPVDLTLAYDPALMGSTFQDQLDLRVWDGSAWVPAACGDMVRDVEAGTLQVPVCTTGQFALFGPVKISIFIPSVRK